MPAPPFASELLGWRASGKNKLHWPHVPNCSDVDSRESLQLGAGMLAALGLGADSPDYTPPENPSGPLEEAVRSHLDGRLPELNPSRQWQVGRGRLITDFAQYAHLKGLDEAIANDPNLRVTLGRDYLIKPDVTVGLVGTPTASGLPFLHAAVSCKWTIRSDRVQNIRHECNQMIRHRRGRQPHLVTVTAEPLPSRLASIARGTGEVDAVYHLAFDELEAAVADSQNAAQQEVWHEVVGQGRLLNIEVLASSLAVW